MSTAHTVMIDLSVRITFKPNREIPTVWTTSDEHGEMSLMTTGNDNDGLFGVVFKNRTGPLAPPPEILFERKNMSIFRVNRCGCQCRCCGCHGESHYIERARKAVEKLRKEFSSVPDIVMTVSCRSLRTV